MIDSDGFRPNVGIILTDGRSRLFWARRLGQDAWQFPQGGIKRDESPEEALFRELHEEVGLEPEQVEIMGCTRRWLRYRLPDYLIRHHRKPLCIGQKQVWYMLRLTAEENSVDLGRTEHPEFDHWCWVDYWRPLREVVFFKRRVYDQALSELAPLLFPQGAPDRPPRPHRRPRRPRREQT